LQRLRVDREACQFSRSGLAEGFLRDQQHE
jgi:hypothetical protein